jgi:hypothetical protein
MIVREIYESEWIDNLLDDELANWSYEAAVWLYDYYFHKAQDTGVPFVLDLDLISSEWTEYSEEDARKCFGVEHSHTEVGLNRDPRIEKVLVARSTFRNTWKYLVKLKR